jgi:hypothetical protein
MCPFDKGEHMKLAKTIALSVAAIGFAAGSAMAAEGTLAPDDMRSSTEPMLAQEETYVLFEPVELQVLYEVDEDGDGMADYLILEGSDDTLAALADGQSEVEIPEGG